MIISQRSGAMTMIRQHTIRVKIYPETIQSYKTCSKLAGLLGL